MQYLYRHYDRNNRLLYVGISNNPYRRLGTHLRKSHWSHDIVNMRIARYDTREAVQQAEREAIHREKPRHNILMNGQKKTLRKRGISWLGWLVLVGALVGGAQWSGIDVVGMAQGVYDKLITVMPSSTPQ